MTAVRIQAETKNRTFCVAVFLMQILGGLHRLAERWKYSDYVAAAASDAFFSGWKCSFFGVLAS